MSTNLQSLLGTGFYVKIHHILASSYKRFMFIGDNKTGLFCVRISEELYKYLKCNGVPTSQWLRYHKEFLNED